MFYTKVDRTVEFSYHRKVIHLARRWLQPGQPIPFFVLVAPLLLFWIEEVVCLYEMSSVPQMIYGKIRVE